MIPPITSISNAQLLRLLQDGLEVSSYAVQAAKEHVNRGGMGVNIARETLAHFSSIRIRFARYLAGRPGMNVTVEQLLEDER